jgi:hypothetical protein
MTRPPFPTVYPARLLPYALLPIVAGLVAILPARVEGQQSAPAAPSPQEASPRSELRAFNFARNYGVRLNGGLSKYHPQGCMFASAAPDNPCLVRRDAEGFTFRFLGGPPGWQVEGVAATVETELTISLDGTSLVRVVYNGVPRQR